MKHRIMYYRFEVTFRPDLADPNALRLVREMGIALPEIASKIRWCRVLDVYWLAIDLSREEFVTGLKNIIWDPVTQWIFTGNLLPAAAGKCGNLKDLMETAPHRPGCFFGLEIKARGYEKPDNPAEALTKALSWCYPNASHISACSGQIVLLEGQNLNDEDLEHLACHFLVEPSSFTWAVLGEEELKQNSRFHQQRIAVDLPRLRFSHLPWRMMEEQALSQESVNFDAEHILKCLLHPVASSHAYREAWCHRPWEIGDFFVKIQTCLEIDTLIDTAYISDFMKLMRSFVYSGCMQQGYHPDMGFFYPLVTSMSSVLHASAVTPASQRYAMVFEQAVLELQQKGHWHNVFFNAWNIDSYHPFMFFASSLHVSKKQSKDLLGNTSWEIYWLDFGEWFGFGLVQEAYFLDFLRLCEQRYAVMGFLPQAFWSAASSFLQQGYKVVLDGIMLRTFAHAQAFLEALYKSEEDRHVGLLVVPMYQAQEWKQFIDTYSIKAPKVGSIQKDSPSLELHWGSTVVAQWDALTLEKNLQSVAAQSQAQASRAAVVPSMADASSVWSFEVLAELKEAHEQFFYSKRVRLSTLGQQLVHLLAQEVWKPKEDLLGQQFFYESDSSMIIRPSHMLGISLAQGGVYYLNDGVVMRIDQDAKIGIIMGRPIASHKKMAQKDFLGSMIMHLQRAVGSALSVQSGGVQSQHFGITWVDSCLDPSFESLLYDVAQHLGIQFLSVKRLAWYQDKIFYPKNFQPSQEKEVFLRAQALGAIYDVHTARSSEFKNAGDSIFLIGPWDVLMSPQDVPSMMKMMKSLNTWLADEQESLGKFCKALHVLGDGGVVMSVAEMAVARGLGVSLVLPYSEKWLELYFSTNALGMLVSVATENIKILESLSKKFSVYALRIGSVELHDRFEVTLHQEDGFSELLLNIPITNIQKLWK